MNATNVLWIHWEKDLSFHNLDLSLFPSFVVIFDIRFFLSLWKAKASLLLTNLLKYKEKKRLSRSDGKFSLWIIWGWWIFSPYFLKAISRYRVGSSFQVNAKGWISQLTYSFNEIWKIFQILPKLHRNMALPYIVNFIWICI